ncbi:RNA 2',3'-cyclic phosphodiesterase [Pseudomonadota bacterium]
MQRLFFALWPDHELRNRINTLASELPGQGGQRHHPDDLHMTLVFLGSVAPAQRACIEQIGDEVQVNPFTLSLDQIDYWARPRILFLGATDTPAPLASLVESLQSGLVGCGFKPEERAYKPHVTLIRKAKQPRTFNFVAPIDWTVSEFVLAGSCAGEPPPRYQVLKRWSLKNV